jgi:hypothetical protein
VMLPIKTSGQMPLHIQKEMARCNEMNNKIINVDVNMWGIARNVIKRISSVYSMNRVIQRYIIDVIATYRFGNDSCTRIGITITSEFQ